MRAGAVALLVAPAMVVGCDNDEALQLEGLLQARQTLLARDYSDALPVREREVAALRAELDGVSQRVGASKSSADVKEQLARAVSQRLAGGGPATWTDAVAPPSEFEVWPVPGDALADPPAEAAWDVALAGPVATASAAAFAVLRSGLLVRVGSLVARVQPSWMLRVYRMKPPRLVDPPARPVQTGLRDPGSVPHGLLSSSRARNLRDEIAALEPRLKAWMAQADALGKRMEELQILRRRRDSMLAMERLARREGRVLAALLNAARAPGVRPEEVRLGGGRATLLARGDPAARARAALAVPLEIAPRTSDAGPGMFQLEIPLRD